MCICALQNFDTIKLITTDNTNKNNRLSGDDRESSFLSVAVQRFNSILLHDSFFWFMITGLVVDAFCNF